MDGMDAANSISSLYVTYAEFLLPAHRMLNGRRIGITKSITDAYAFA